ncbi:MAG: nucleotidyltransferase domain-containing protein [Candidatus Diapherotrites archaeon]|uniref:Nucleotidyltransferase domain-containing protein n=1 Tax=Candidatus Iainarchaeum sp. TaxID=3101447 RepID=A0A8T4KUH9_9ARCH|nr:nucleotidyltransferase domain-containing protein [Candidatus Diapherotrites archaeon]
MRELSRRTEIAQTSVINHLKELLKEQLIIKEKKGIYPTFKANRDDEMFKLYKKNDLLLKIRQTGLVDFIYDSCLPDAIMLFGSASKGEDLEESDIDLYVKAKEKKLNLQRYEKLLNRKITLFFKENFSELGNELKNNIINGIVITGYLKVF